MRIDTTIDFTKYKRFFAFGCSFTNWCWPTWATIISKEIHNYYNYGMPGAGNQFIFSQIIEANARFRFSDTDLIIIMWTGTDRVDIYTDKWQPNGGLANGHIIPQSFVKEFTSTRGCDLRDSIIITACEDFMETKNADYDFLSMSDYHERADDISSLLPFTIKPSIHELIFGGDWNSKHRLQTKLNDQIIIDLHPMPLYHYEYLLKIYPDTVFLPTTDSYIRNENEYLKNVVKVIDRTTPNYLFSNIPVPRL